MRFFGAVTKPKLLAALSLAAIFGLAIGVFGGAMLEHVGIAQRIAAAFSGNRANQSGRAWPFWWRDRDAGGESSSIDSLADAVEQALRGMGGGEGGSVGSFSAVRRHNVRNQIERQTAATGLLDEMEFAITVTVAQVDAIPVEGSGSAAYEEYAGGAAAHGESGGEGGAAGSGVGGGASGAAGSGVGDVFGGGVGGATGGGVSGAAGSGVGGVGDIFSADLQNDGAMRTVSAYNLYDPEPEAYAAAYLAMARAYIGSRMESEANEASERAPQEPSAAPGMLPRLARVLHVSARLSDGVWEAKADIGEAIALGIEIACDVDAKAEEMLAADGWYNELLAAVAFRSMLEGSFPDPEFGPLVAIERVFALDGGAFAVQAIYPDPEEVYGMAAQRCYDTVASDIEASGQPMYYTFSQNDLADMYTESVEAQFGKYARRIERPNGGAASSTVVASFAGASLIRTTLTLETGETGMAINGQPPDCEDLDVLGQEVGTARGSALRDVVARINSELVAQEVERPETGVLSGDSIGQRVDVKLSDSGDRHFVFFRLPEAEAGAGAEAGTGAEAGAGADVDAYAGADIDLDAYAYAGADVDADGEIVLSAFARAGEPLQIHLPAGVYKLIVGSGDKWYGEPASYGSLGKYELVDVPIAIRPGFAYTLELVGDASLPMRPIRFPY